MDDISARQRRILEFIRQTVQQRGYPPTVREIGEAVGLTSSSSVHAQLSNLERRGPLPPDPTQTQALGVPGRGGRTASRVGGAPPRRGPARRPPPAPAEAGERPPF